ncbi:histidine phosphatase family protein [Pseudonocardia sp. GCM10023141]|uniref:histidine phosphatase family protein n=1 Tax=Pseudonocardia sp. GCM10023141 TaxID=3252653 RepID=UPI0036115B25
MTELTIVRHGQTVWHAENRYCGVSDIPLTDTGRAQAARLGEWARVHPHDVLACSPLARARDTIAPVAAALGREPELLADLSEVDFGVAEGRTMAELRVTDPVAAELFVADPVRHPFPGGEPLDRAAARTLGALRGLVERRRGSRVLVVAHSTALRLALCGWLGIPLARYRDVFPQFDNAAITRLRVPADPSALPALLCLNVPTSGS